MNSNQIEIIFETRPGPDTMRTSHLQCDSSAVNNWIPIKSKFLLKPAPMQTQCEHTNLNVSLAQWIFKSQSNRNYFRNPPWSKNNANIPPSMWFWRSQHLNSKQIKIFLKPAPIQTQCEPPTFNVTLVQSIIEFQSNREYLFFPPRSTHNANIPPSM